MVHLVGKSHLQAFVEFVYHSPHHATRVNVGLVQMVVEPSWRGKDHMWHQLAQLAMFVHGRASAMAGITSDASFKAGQHFR